MSTWDIYLPNELVEEKGLAYQSVDVLVEEFGRCVASPMQLDESELVDDTMTMPSECINELIRLRTSVSEHDDILEPSEVKPVRRAPLMDTDVNARPAYSPSFNKPVQKSSTFDPWVIIDPVTRHARRPLLHEFILQLLATDQYSHLAEYTDRKHGIFKFHDPIGVATLWSSVKRRNSGRSKSCNR